ncbi:carbon-nitrogen hydrolase family protein [Dongshaea marina]|uniref:carbon-nitrogen hydrolase family protein n=1 Tax=Dongshaea marina TaxID=2047966 RepID=UPI000D3E794E|nr:carbon-nitrogen hydrolase family protein [Dongshaea marina]
MRHQLSLSLIQSGCCELDIDQQWCALEEMLCIAAGQGSEWAVFPELCNLPLDFSLAVNLVQEEELVVCRLKNLAKRYNIWLTGSFGVRDRASGKMRNRLYCLDPQGELRARYDKIHQIRRVNEQQYFVAGEHLVICQTPWGRVGFAICYDIHFPNMFREYALNGTRLIIVPSAIRQHRVDNWQRICQVRALENQQYMVMMSSCGQSEHGGDFSSLAGRSSIMTPRGERLVEAATSSEIVTQTIDLSLVEKARDEYPVLAATAGPLATRFF